MILKRFASLWGSEKERWMIAALVFTVIWLAGWISTPLVQADPAVWFILITVIAALAAGLFMSIILLRQHQRDTRNEIQRLTIRATQANAQISGVYKLSALYSQATTESEMIEALIKLCIDLVGAQGASYVPLDERRQPMAAQTEGELPFQSLTAWVEYLATPAIRQRCQICQNYAHLNTTCPLLKAPFNDVYGLFCLPIRSGDHEWGVLNLYMPQQVELNSDTEAFLKTLLQDTALALESRRLRQRELESVQQMRQIQQRTDLSGLLTALLENIQSAFSAEVARIELVGKTSRRRIVLGEAHRQVELALEQAIDSVFRNGDAIQIHTSNGVQKPDESQYSLLAVPLFSREKRVIGALVVVMPQNLQKQTHELSLLHAFAAQVELVIENADLLAEIEYRSVIQERTRLAREIHDGLAQTIGLLKLQSAQSMNYLNKADSEKLRSTLNTVHATLSEAYLDIRSAIDGLRIDADHTGSMGWVNPMLKEFEELAEISTHLEMDSQPGEIPTEIQTQLIRIIQEALNNIRKHARAKNVWIRSNVNREDWWLEIQDDGAGFTPEDIPSSSRYGLQGMRERAELIGADFQIVSQKSQGTQIHLRLPTALLAEWESQYPGGTLR